MKMMNRFALTVAALLPLLASANDKAIRKMPLLNDRSGDIKVGSNLGQKIMQNARRLENNNNMNYDFVVNYSIKFQGCHHVSQWNANADDEDDVRIKTKRLVRFRLCPSDSCKNDRASGCTSKYGDYVVDLNTFTAAYLEAIVEDKDDICYDVAYECNQQCNNGEDQDCVDACYDGYGATFCQNDDDGQQDDGFNPEDYAECAQFDLNAGGRRRRLEDDIQYYVGPYCADQGGEIHFGLFTDDTCTTFAENGEETFANTMGFELPYSDTSVISSLCMTCGRNNGNGNYETKDVCNNVYDVSGKCETKMNVDYPNESACTYIEGIRIIRYDGVIRSSAVKKSKTAAVAIGLFLTIAVLLAGYVYYLRTSKSVFCACLCVLVLVFVKYPFHRFVVFSPPSIVLLLFRTTTLTITLALLQSTQLHSTRRLQLFSIGLFLLSFSRSLCLLLFVSHTHRAWTCNGEPLCGLASNPDVDTNLTYGQYH